MRNIHPAAAGVNPWRQWTSHQGGCCGNERENATRLPDAHRGRGL